MKERIDSVMNYQMKMGNYNVGLPGGKSYRKLTPKPVRIVGDSLIFVGSVVTFVAAFSTPPGWVLMVGGLSAMAGRFIAKCFSYSNN